MKIPLVLLLTATASVLSLVPAAHAEPPATAKKRAQAKEVVKDPELSLLTFKEMMKDREKKRSMAQALAKDKEGREFFYAEVGNDAPHQERNPSQHPELFRAKQP